MRLLNLIVAAALVLAAAYVYRIKVAATVEAERVAKLHMEITRERDMIAALRAETAKLENPARIQRLADRYLSLQALDPAQIEALETIPLRKTDTVEPEIVTAAPAQPEAAPAKAPTSGKTANPPVQPQTASRSNPQAQPQTGQPLSLQPQTAAKPAVAPAPAQTANRPPSTPTAPSQAASRPANPPTQSAPLAPATAAVRPKSLPPQPAPVSPWDIITGSVRPPAPIGAQ